MLLLHGFPEFWWTWRQQLSSLSQAGYRVVAPDLRGYGGSDKPPRGYDLVTAASDAAGLVRSLGEANAVVVGHDWGGLIAWTMATYHPKVVRRLAVVSMPHPLRLRAAFLSAPFTHARSMGYALGFQLPMLPERRLLKDGAQRVGKLLSAWSGPGWPDPETRRRYEEAMSVPSVAHSALEYHRWYLRSRFRPGRNRLHQDDASAHSGANLALAWRTRPVRAAERGQGIWRPRRGAVPVAAARWRRPFPARGSP